MQSVIHRYLMITLGSIVCALGICAFFMPYHLLSGGVSGLCILLYYVFNLPVGVTNIILNIPLFYLAYKAMSKDYVLCGIFGMLVLSISIDALTFSDRCMWSEICCSAVSPAALFKASVLP
jgi:uncharacterized membrane-anchored protein YitT (DUF2179 family)